MDFKPTDEQQAIVDARASTKDHILIVARAGAAKTSTLCLLAEQGTHVKSGLALAFNVSMKNELKERLPSNYRCLTLNGLGHMAWGRFLGKRLSLDKDKNYRLLRGAIDMLTDKHDQDEAFENFTETKQAVAKAKVAGYIPLPVPQAYRPLCSEEDFFLEVLDFEPSPLQRDLINRVCAESFREACQGIIDFDDQLLCAAVAGVRFDFYEEIFVDESQDLNAIQHKLISKLIKPGTRLIAVGDPLQAIYGFRGADTSSMENMKRRFNMQEFHLTMTFRCATRIVENAQWRAPDMRAAPTAPEGEILRPETFALEDIPDNTAIICRNNAPLFSLAIRLLRAGRYPELRGRDVLKSIVAKMKKLGKPKLTREEAMASLQGWYATEKLKQKDQNLLADTRDCMAIFIEETDTLGSAMAFAKSLEERSGRIALMTGHKSKGLEFDEVFFLDSGLINMKNEQDKNLRYVIETRAKRKLTYIYSDALVEAAMVE